MRPQLPDWANRHPLGLGLAGCALLGLAFGWFGNPLPRADNLNSAAAHWKLPSQNQLSRYDERTFQAVRTSNAWPASENLAARRFVRGRLQQPSWSLVGVVLTPTPVALILDRSEAGTAGSNSPPGRPGPRNEGTVSRLAVGASLPDGSRLEKITHDSIVVSSQGCTTRVDLFHGNPRESAESPICTGGTDAAKTNTPGKRP